SLDIAAETVRYDFDETYFALRNFRNLPIVLPEIVAGLNLVHQTVFRLHESVKAAAHFESADHLQGIERETFEELAVAPRARAQAGLGARVRTRGLKRRAQVAGVVDEAFVRLYLRQRLYPSAGLFLGLRNPLLQIGLTARASGRHTTREQRRTDHTRSRHAFHFAPPVFFFAAACPAPSSSI